ncbi:hypothetical protein D4764_22G0004410 [Takifugu flavidus]|uniref:Uncharacterized protein n=1 Tax=Takifugu flavidus TaxID=433684 RepID=A0A5C6NBI9_9TELE|nr:hypothetical protein D4764_22G0004410 [Takifugu flavidus]
MAGKGASRIDFVCTERHHAEPARPVRRLTGLFPACYFGEHLKVCRRALFQITRLLTHADTCGADHADGSHGNSRSQQHQSGSSKEDLDSGLSVDLAPSPRGPRSSQGGRETFRALRAPHPNRSLVTHPPTLNSSKRRDDAF